MEKAKRIGYIDILKCIGIILIVFGHIYTNQIIYTFLYSFHVAIFFFIAGFLYKQQPTVKNIKHKFYTTIVPYLVFGLIELLYWQFIEKRFRTSNLQFQDGLLGLISGKYSLLDFNVHLWFLPAYFSTIIVFDLLTKIFGEKWNIIAIIILSLLYVFINPIQELIFGIEKIPQYILFVYLGRTIRKFNINEKIEKLNRKLLICYSTSAILFVILFILNYYNLNQKAMWFVCGTLGIIASFLLSIAMDNKYKTLNEIGKCTLVVLCVHGPLYRIIVKVCSIITKQEVDMLRANFVISAIITIITIGICYIIYKLLDKFLPWIIGKKTRKAGDAN